VILESFYFGAFENLHAGIDQEILQSLQARQRIDPIVPP
jgi:hypothetical protein